MSDEACAEILRTMKGLIENHPDPIWVSPGETLFERLYGIYCDLGGDMGAMEDAFPSLWKTKNILRKP
jgi:hypothetical protein